MDKSFEGLILSLVLHILFLVFLWNAKIAPVIDGRPTEIVLIEKPASKARTIVTETEPKDLAEDLKHQADFLSQFTKRVKKQMRAAKIGPTVNATPQPSVKTQESQQKHVAGMKPDQGEGIGTPGTNTNQAMRNIAIGQSSIAEYIPGIKEGAFSFLNTDQFTYYTFYSRMGEQTRNRWISNVRNFMSTLTTRELESLSTRDRHTVVEIILSPDGGFSSSVVHNSSGDRRLDQAVVEAFRAAAPFQNPPRGMVQNDGLIHIYADYVVLFSPPSFGPAG